MILGILFLLSAITCTYDKKLIVQEGETTVVTQKQLLNNKIKKGIYILDSSNSNINIHVHSYFKLSPASIIDFNSAPISIENIQLGSGQTLNYFLVLTKDQFQVYVIQDNLAVSLVTSWNPSQVFEDPGFSFSDLVILKFDYQQNVVLFIEGTPTETDSDLQSLSIVRLTCEKSQQIDSLPNCSLKVDNKILVHHPKIYSNETISLNPCRAKNVIPDKNQYLSNYKFIMCRFCPLNNLIPTHPDFSNDLQIIQVDLSSDSTSSIIEYLTTLKSIQAYNRKESQNLQVLEVVIFNLEFEIVNYSNINSIEIKNLKEDSDQIVATTTHNDKREYSKCFSRKLNQITCFDSISSNVTNHTQMKVNIRQIYKNNFFSNSDMSTVFQFPHRSLPENSGIEPLETFKNFMILKNITHPQQIQLLSLDSFEVLDSLTLSNEAIMIRRFKNNQPRADFEGQFGYILFKNEIINNNTAKYTLKSIRLSFPFYEINMEGTGYSNNPVCLEYLYGCSLLEFDFYNAANQTDSSKIQVYALSKNKTGNILPQYNTTEFTYSFIGGTLSIEPSKLFYGWVKGLSLSSNNFYPTNDSEYSLPKINNQKVNLKLDKTKFQISFQDRELIFLDTILRVHTWVDERNFASIIIALINENRMTLQYSKNFMEITDDGHKYFSDFFGPNLVIELGDQPPEFNRNNIFHPLENFFLLNLYNETKLFYCNDDQSFDEIKLRGYRIQNPNSSIKFSRLSKDSLIIVISNSTSLQITKMHLYENFGHINVLARNIYAMETQQLSNKYLDCSKVDDLYLSMSDELIVKVDNRIGVYASFSDSSESTLSYDIKFNLIYFINFQDDFLTFFDEKTDILLFLTGAVELTDEKTYYSDIKYVDLNKIVNNDYFEAEDCTIFLKSLLSQKDNQEYRVYFSGAEKGKYIYGIKNSKIKLEVEVLQNYKNDHYDVIFDTSDFTKSSRWSLNQQYNDIYEKVSLDSESKYKFDISYKYSSQLRMFSFNIFWMEPYFEINQLIDRNKAADKKNAISIKQEYSLILQAVDGIELEQKVSTNILQSMNIKQQALLSSDLRINKNTISLKNMFKGVLADSTIECYKGNTIYELESETRMRVRCDNQATTEFVRPIQKKFGLLFSRFPDLGKIRDIIILKKYPQYALVLFEDEIIGILRLTPFTNFKKLYKVILNDKIYSEITNFISVRYEYNKVIIKAAEFTFDDDRIGEIVFDEDDLKNEIKFDPKKNDNFIRSLALTPQQILNQSATYNYEENLFNKMIGSRNFESMGNLYWGLVQVDNISMFNIYRTNYVMNKTGNGMVESENIFTSLNKLENSSWDRIPISFKMVDSLTLNRFMNFTILITFKYQEEYEISSTKFSYDLAQDVLSFEQQKSTKLNETTSEILFNTYYEDGKYNDYYILTKFHLKRYSDRATGTFSYLNKFNYMSTCQDRSTFDVDQFKDYVFLSCRNSIEITGYYWIVVYKTGQNFESDGSMNPIQVLKFSFQIEHDNAKIISFFTNDKKDYILMRHPTQKFAAYEINSGYSIVSKSNFNLFDSVSLKIIFSNLYIYQVFAISLGNSPYQMIIDFWNFLMRETALQAFVFLYLVCCFLMFMGIRNRQAKWEEMGMDSDERDDKYEIDRVIRIRNMKRRELP